MILKKQDTSPLYNNASSSITNETLLKILIFEKVINSVIYIDFEWIILVDNVRTMAI